MARVKREAAALHVRAMIADGRLKPGAAVPSGAALAKVTGCHANTCLRALRDLAREGVLVPGISATARLRVPAPGLAASGQMPPVVLARALAACRHVCGLTQPELAEKLGVSVTTVGHAETGLLWQSRSFWERADRKLGAGGSLVWLYDLYQAVPRETVAASEDRNGEAAGEETAAGAAVRQRPEHPWAADAERRVRAGESVKSVARLYGVAPRTVGGALGRRGVPYGRNALPAWAGDAKTRYEAGEAPRALAGDYGVGHNVVRRVLAKQGVKTRTRSEAMKARAAKKTSPAQAAAMARGHPEGG